MPKHVGVELERTNNKKIHYFLEHLLVFLCTILQDARFNHQDYLAVLTPSIHMTSTTADSIISVFMFIMLIYGSQCHIDFKKNVRSLHWLMCFFVRLASEKNMALTNSTVVNKENIAW
jgi:hypothetical protein